MATFPPIPKVPSLPSVPKVPSIQLPGSVIDAATKAANAAKAAAEAAVPSFDSLMSAAKASVTGAAGGLFKDTSAAVASVGAAQFGIGGDSPDLKAFEAYKQQVADVQKNAVIDMAIAKAGLAQKAMEATAAGKAIGGAAIAGALAATKSIQNLQANLSNPAALAADIAASAAAKADTIASLKANTMLAMLSKPMAAGLAGAMGAALDPALINNLTKLNIIKAQETEASQEPPGEEQPSDTVRPKSSTTDTNVEAASPPPITPPPVDKKIYGIEIANFSDRVSAARKAYYAYIGIKWKKGDPEPSKEVQNKSFFAIVEEKYDKVVGRDGANKERIAARAIKDAKPDETTRTEEEKALIAKTDVERNTFNTGEWMNGKAAVWDTYIKLFERYKQAYDCWINNGDRFTLPADIEQELKK
jgi:hypothetical protein